jgi:hypothetical protein
MINFTIICSISASLLTFIITKKLYDNTSYIYRIEKRLDEANRRLDNYKRSGAIEKKQIFECPSPSSNPSEKKGLESLVCYYRWVPIDDEQNNE